VRHNVTACVGPHPSLLLFHVQKQSTPLPNMLHANNCQTTHMPRAAKPYASQLLPNNTHATHCQTIHMRRTAKPFARHVLPHNTHATYCKTIRTCHAVPNHTHATSCRTTRMPHTATQHVTYLEACLSHAHVHPSSLGTVVSQLTCPGPVRGGGCAFPVCT
jgi:hypothetical protein